MPITLIRKTVVSTPSICHDLSARLDGTLHKRNQCRRRTVADNLKPNAASISTVPPNNSPGALRFTAANFDGGDNKGLIGDASAKAACLTSNPRLINFDMILWIGTNPVAIRETLNKAGVGDGLTVEA